MATTALAGFTIFLFTQTLENQHQAQLIAADAKQLNFAYRELDEDLEKLEGAVDKISRDQFSGMATRWTKQDAVAYQVEIKQDIVRLQSKIQETLMAMHKLELKLHAVQNELSSQQKMLDFLIYSNESDKKGPF